MSSPTLKPEKENLQLKSNRNRDSNLSYDKNNKILLNKKRKPDNINKSNVSKSYSEEKKKQMKKKENKKENKKNFTENKPKKSYRKRNKKDDSISSENEYEKEKINSNKKSEHIYEILYSSEEENNQNDKKIYLNKELKSKNYSENKILLMTKDSSRSSSQKKDNIIKEKISENNNLKSTSQDINDKRIFIGNIDYKCQEKELQEYFKNCGRITDVKIEKTYDGKSRGHGYIDFENKNSIEIALKKDGKLFQGRKLVIKKYIDKGTNSMIFLEEKFKNLESSNKKLEGELKGTQNELKETQNELKETQNELKGTKNELKGTQNKLKGTQNELKEAQNEIKKNKNEIRQINIKFGLLNEINEQSDIYYNKNINILNSKVNALLNSYKILYIRKMSHFILNEIITKYKKNLALSETEFKERGFPYHLIVAQDNIKGISKFQINSIFDYLRYISYFTSKIIHLNKKNIKIQKEIFYEILGKTNKKNDKIIVTIDDMTNIIFGNRDELDNIDKRSKFTEINNNLIQIINKYIREEEKKEKEDNEEEQGVEDNEEEQEKEDNEEEQGEEDNEEEQEKSDEEEQKKGNEEEQGEEDNEEEQEEDNEEQQEKSNEEKQEKSNEEEQGEEEDEEEQEEEDNEEEQEEEDEEKQKKEEEIKRRQNTSKKKEINISEYYNDENECKKIKNIISGEKIYNVKIKNLLQKLSKIIEMNINLKSNNITKYKNIEINSEYFYKLWLESFKFRDKNYKKFIKTEYLNSAAEMGKIVKIILNNNIKKGLFDYDSGKFEQRIKKTILKY